MSAGCLTHNLVLLVERKSLLKVFTFSIRFHPFPSTSPFPCLFFHCFQLLSGFQGYPLFPLDNTSCSDLIPFANPCEKNYGESILSLTLLLLPLAGLNLIFPNSSWPERLPAHTPHNQTKTSVQVSRAPPLLPYTSLRQTHSSVHCGCSAQFSHGL